MTEKELNCFNCKLLVQKHIVLRFESSEKATEHIEDRLKSELDVVNMQLLVVCNGLDGIIYQTQENIFYITDFGSENENDGLDRSAHVCEVRLLVGHSVVVLFESVLLIFCIPILVSIHEVGKGDNVHGWLELDVEEIRIHSLFHADVDQVGEVLRILVFIKGS